MEAWAPLSKADPATLCRKLILVAWIRDLVVLGYYPQGVTVGEGWDVDGPVKSFSLGLSSLLSTTDWYHAGKMSEPV